MRKEVMHRRSKEKQQIADNGQSFATEEVSEKAVSRKGGSSHECLS
jgi:hypothetical protein